MQIPSLLTSNWSSLLSALPGSVDLTALARSTGAIVRRRRIDDGETLLRLALWYGPGGLSLRSTAALAGGTGVAELSDVALLKRLSGAADWLQALIAAQLNQRDAISKPRQLGCERPLVLVDATVICPPGGGRRKDWLVHTRYDPAAGFSGFELTDPQSAESLRRHPFAPGDIVVADRGYARAKGLAYVLEQDADFIVRVGWTSLSLRNADGKRFDLLAALEHLKPEETTELALHVVTQDRCFPIRLVVRTRDEDETQAERRRVKRKTLKNQAVGNPKSQLAARYMMIATSLDPQTYPADRIIDLYRLRWQIELAFKRLKSLLHLGRLPAKNRNLARTWLNAHLLLALLIDDITRQTLDSPPCAPDNAATKRLHMAAS